MRLPTVPSSRHEFDFLVTGDLEVEGLDIRSAFRDRVSVDLVEHTVTVAVLDSVGCHVGAVCLAVILQLRTREATAERDFSH
jgi:hypothetical protein